MYVMLTSKPDSAIALYNDGYSQLPPTCILGCLPVIRRATLCWELLRALSILGFSTYVSALNNNTARFTALKTFPDTFGTAPSHLKIRYNRPQLFLSL